MKSEYLKNLISIKQPSKNAYQSYITRINILFQKLKHNPTNIALAKFQTQLHAAKDHKEIKPKDKQPLFKFFVERNIHDFLFLKDSNSDLRLLKLVKTQLEDYQLDWKELWERLLDQYPELPSVKIYNELTDFLRNIRHLYSPDNAVDVIQYFMERHSLYTENLCTYISLFINITHKTSSKVFAAYLDKIFQLYHLNQLKASDLLVMFLNASKYKQTEISQSVHAQLNKIVLYSLSTPSSNKKDSIQNKFSTQTANILFRIIGKCNGHSIDLLKQVFQMLKLFIRPFQDSKKPLKFLCIFIMGISKRIQTEEGYREKIVKLKVKQEKKLEGSQEEELKSKHEEQGQDSAVTIPAQSSKQQTGPQKEEEEQSEEQDEDENDSDEQDQDNKVQKMIKMQLQLQENIPQKQNSLQIRIQKLQSLLRNYITPEIKQFFKEFITKHLEEIFYVNSKKMVSRILKECFNLFPELITVTVDILEKAGNIPTINEDGLITNIKQIAKHLFSKHLIENGTFLDHILKLLSRVKESRRITDVWDILNTFMLKLPLLDEKDMQVISEQKKQAFQKKYNQKHDLFYESYSDDIFECIKRVFTQSQYYDSTTPNSVDKNITDILSTCHPHFKKRILKEMQEQILENNNKFLLSIYHTGLRPSKSFQISLKEMIQHGNIENQQNMAFNISVNTILSMDMDIGSIKELIRKYSKKNNYKFLRQIMASLTNYNICYQPLCSSLEYLSQKPELVMNQEPSFKLIADKISHVYDYGQEVIDQLLEELKEFEDQPLKKMPYEDIVKQIYSKQDHNFKDMKVEKRKTINELLEILKIIAEHLFHEFEEYNPEKGTIQFKPAPYKRESFLNYEKFRTIVSYLTYNQLFLHDPNIMLNLTTLIENQIYFMYRHYIRLQKQVLKKYSKSNKREELLGESNPIYAANISIGKVRIAHFSILYNQYKDSVGIQPIKEELKILLIAPSNEKSGLINKILVKKSEQIQKEADRLIFFLSNIFDSRFYYEKVFSLLADFLTSGYKFSPEQILSIITYHIPLLQSENIKIKQHSLRSFDRFFKTLKKGDLFGMVEQKLREFIKKEKLELIWIISVLIINKEGRKDTPVQVYLQQVSEYLKGLEALIVSDTRIVRRMALFTYSFCFRRARQAVKVVERVTCPSLQYSKPKTIPQIYETGFLREEHIDSKKIAHKEMLQKLAPYSTYHKKEYIQSQAYTKMVENSFQFILSNPQLGLKLLKQFHLDMAASVEQVLSMMSNKKYDLSEIAFRTLQGCYVYAKLQKLHFDRFQYHFGESFFQYMFNKDAKNNQMKFFMSTKQEIEEMINNLEGYDNQTLIFIYLSDLLAAYGGHCQEIGEERRKEVEKFVLKVVTEMIYKGSGSIFKQLMVLLSRCKQRKALTFLITFFQNLIHNKQKVSRACQLLFTLCQDNYQIYAKTVKQVLSNNLQINNSYINTILNTVLTLPEKYMLTGQQITRYGIIDLKEELSQQNLQKLYDAEIYLPSTHGLNDFLIGVIQKYVESINQPAQNEEETKEKNELIKATYSITTNLISTFCQFYQTPESTAIILKLLDLLFGLLASKMDLPIDYKQLEETIKTLLSNKHDHIGNFETAVDLVLGHVGKLPVKKQAEIIKIIANRPGNFHFVRGDYYQKFIYKLLALEEHSMIYKDLLISLSTLLSYVPLPLEQIEKTRASVSKGQSLLLMQAYVMSTEDIAGEFIDHILSNTSRQRRNIFCKQMLHLRGKKEYLDNEQAYVQWKKIKQYSNPYHYHA